MVAYFSLFRLLYTQPGFVNRGWNAANILNFRNSDTCDTGYSKGLWPVDLLFLQLVLIITYEPVFGNWGSNAANKLMFENSDTLFYFIVFL